MQWFSNFKMNTKLYFGFGILAIIVLVVAYGGYWGVGRLSAHVFNIGEVNMPNISCLHEISEGFVSISLAQRTLLNSDLSFDDIAYQLGKIQAARKQYKIAIKAYEVLKHSKQETVEWKKLLNYIDEWRKENDVFDKYLEAIVTLGIHNSVELERDINRYHNEHENLMEIVENFIRGLGKDEKIVDYTKCNFGRWLSSYSTRNPEISKTIEEMRMPHKQFHDVASKIAGLVKAGSREKAQIVYDQELKVISKRILMLSDRIRMIVENDGDLYRKLNKQVMGKCRRNKNLAIGSLNKIVEINEELASLEIKNAEAAAKTVKSIIIGCSIAGIVFALLFGLGISWNISSILETFRIEMDRLVKGAIGGQLDVRGQSDNIHFEFRPLIEGVNETLDAVISPLNMAANYIDRISRGDLPSKITDQYNGDFNVIKNNLNTCIDNIKALIVDADMMSKAAIEGRLETRADASKHQGDYRKIIEGVNLTLDSVVLNLSNLNLELQKGISVLATSSTEILATVSQVASGATEVVAAVSETSTTAEEVKQTAEVSNQKAKYVQENAKKIATVSEAGQKAVNETVDGMNNIREQMGAIAESVVRLSEQGQTIGEIIATVSDLAEQSNLLAVNAAIEATRAGEFGKSFSVVAQEVKSLAEQSRQATTQVRTILMEIQKATSAAVMATEQGSKAVAVGVKQAEKAGDSIRLLSKNVSEASQAATQIAASSQQQLIGMDQIASAITNIKLATTQNMTGSKQLESSAQNLQELGDRMKLMVEQQKVDD